MWSWFQREVVDEDRLALFLCFSAFVITFVATRVITRLIRSGRGPFTNNVSGSGVHIHHAVPGIILLVTGAFLSVGSGSEAPWAEIAAVVVGIGTSLVLDEFALILHLEDVYWSNEGRISVQMVSLAVACLGLGFLGINPFDFGTDAGAAAITATAIAIVFHLALVVVCVSKGKYRVALFGVFVPLIAGVGSLRLARPSSRWARRYHGRKLAKAQARSATFNARWDPIADRISNFIAGKPSEPDPDPAPS